MKLADWKKKLTWPVIIIALLVTLLAVATSCEDFGYPPTTPPEEKPDAEPVAPVTAIRTKDAALIAVYQRLLDQAKSYEAKIYLSDFYAYCDNWSAVSEYFKDGSATWYVVVDMTANKTWEMRPYWQQASWFVFKDGEVIPSNLFHANALRIEADLQALSPEPEPGPGEESES